MWLQNKIIHLSKYFKYFNYAIMFVFGRWAIIPMMYPFSRLFDVPSSAFVTLSCANVFLGTVSTLATFILEILQSDDPVSSMCMNIRLDGLMQFE